MALDKLVDSTQLDSDLTSVANAIRTKGGTSAQLAFPAGFVTAIGNIPSGGVTPTGTKQISITQNGTTTEDVTNYANAEITVNVSGGGGSNYSLSAVFTQGDNKIFTTDALSVLKQYLVVTVTYSDNSTETLSDGAYSLSGTLTAGTSTITVTAMQKTATFTVTVTAATDVTPAFSSWAGGAGSAAVKNATDGAILVESSSNGAYRNANVGITLESGYRYRFTVHVDYFVGQVKITFSNSSYNWITNCSSDILTASGDLSIDCKPSDASNFTASAYLMLYCTVATSGVGKSVFKNIKVIKYAA